MDTLLKSIKGINSWSQNETYPNIFTINTEIGVMYLSITEIETIVAYFDKDLFQWKAFMDEALTNE